MLPHPLWFRFCATDEVRSIATCSSGSSIFSSRVRDAAAIVSQINTGGLDSDDAPAKNTSDRAAGYHAVSIYRKETTDDFICVRAPVSPLRGYSHSCLSGWLSFRRLRSRHPSDRSPQRQKLGLATNAGRFHFI